MRAEIAAAPPALFRSEAFVEDIELLVAPALPALPAVQRLPLEAARRLSLRLLAVPGAASLLGGALAWIRLPV